MTELWWKRFPGRLRKELEAYRTAGFIYAVDRQKFKAGELVVDLTFSLGARNYTLQAVYPNTFPYFEPTVLGFDLGFSLHWNPFGRNLCLLGRRTENWDPQYTLGNLIAEQFPKIVLANMQPREQTLDLEIDQGEPLSTFYSTEPRSLVLVGSEWKIPKQVDGGWLKLGLVSPPSREKLLVAVLEVRDGNHQPLCKLDETIAPRVVQSFGARWQRLPEFVRESDPAKFLSVLSSANERFRHLHWGYRGKFWLDIAGIVFPEEVRRCEYRDGWIFLSHRGNPPPKKKVIPRPQVTRQSFIKAERFGPDEMDSRRPELAFSKGKKIAIIGLGCVGAALALELARAGFQLKLIDADQVEFGPSVRWPLGFEYLGWTKADALNDFIWKQWPYCQTQPFLRRVGWQRGADEEILSGVDLIVDATAELGVQRYLSDLAAEISRPVVMVSTTPGGWGGRIARFLPDRKKEPCHACLCFYEAESHVTRPPADPDGTFQPVGCGDITFRGSGVDTSEISLAGARLVFSTLGEGVGQAYPQTWWNVATLWLRATDGALIEPKLETWRLRPHPRCSNH